MITHFKRVRTDFMKAQARCLDRVCKAGTCADRGTEPCKLPEECEFCNHWVCSACEEVVPWSDGSDGDGGMLCGGCWCRFIRDWLEAEDKLEAKRMQRYKQACAL